MCERILLVKISAKKGEKMRINSISNAYLGLGINRLNSLNVSKQVLFAPITDSVSFKARDNQLLSAQEGEKAVSQTIGGYTDAFAKAIKKCHLILVSNALAESSLSKIKQISEKFSKQLCLIDAQEFEDILESKSIKAAAITDKNLSDAIKNWL